MCVESSLVTHDDSSPALIEAKRKIAELEAQIHSYKREEVARWADVVAESARVAEEIVRIRSTVSWRVTAPLRVFRRKQLGN